MLSRAPFLTVTDLGRAEMLHEKQKGMPTDTVVDAS